MTVALRVCLSQFQTCQCFGLKSRKNIQRCEAGFSAVMATKTKLSARVPTDFPLLYIYNIFMWDLSDHQYTTILGAPLVGQMTEPLPMHQVMQVGHHQWKNQPDPPFWKEQTHYQDKDHLQLQLLQPFVMAGEKGRVTAYERSTGPELQYSISMHK